MVRKAEKERTPTDEIEPEAELKFLRRSVTTTLRRRNVTVFLEEENVTWSPQ